MCDCIEKVNELLAPKNGELSVAFSLTTGIAWPALTVEKIDKRSRIKPPGMVPTHCPFCGERYQDETGRSA